MIKEAHLNTLCRCIITKIGTDMFNNGTTSISTGLCVAIIKLASEAIVIGKCLQLAKEKWKNFGATEK